jgi:hypothetical protein
MATVVQLFACHNLFDINLHLVWHVPNNKIVHNALTGTTNPIHPCLKHLGLHYVGKGLTFLCLCSSSRRRKVSRLTPTTVFALATPESLIDRGAHCIATSLLCRTSVSFRCCCWPPLAAADFILGALCRTIWHFLRKQMNASTFYSLHVAPVTIFTRAHLSAIMSFCVFLL